jgi:hypothetical protein
MKKSKLLPIDAYRRNRKVRRRVEPVEEEDCETAYEMLKKVIHEVNVWQDAAFEDSRQFQRYKVRELVIV